MSDSVERISDERLSEMTAIYRTHPQMYSLLSELQRLRAGRAAVVEALENAVSKCGPKLDCALVDGQLLRDALAALKGGAA
jgi:hypothetical protein